MKHTFHPHPAPGTRTPAWPLRPRLLGEGLLWLLLLLVALPAAAQDPADLVAADYFWDVDQVTNHVAITLPADQSAGLGYPGLSALNVDLSTLPVGLHQLAVRVQNRAGVWSDASWLPVQVYDPTNITVPPVAPPIADTPAQLATAEYFWDAAPAVGLGTRLPVNPDETWSVGYPGSIKESIELSSLDVGLHQLGWRVTDQSGRVSATNWLSVSVFDPGAISVPATPPAINDQATWLANAEYFWDTDPGVGHGLAVGLAADESAAWGYPGPLPFSVDLSSLSPGNHLLGFRVVDNAGRVSAVSSLPVQVYDPGTILAGVVNTVINDQPAWLVSAEYFWDTAPAVGAGTMVPITPDEAFGVGYPLPAPLNVDLSALTVGLHQLGFRTVDNLGRISTTNWLPVSVYDPAIVLANVAPVVISDQPTWLAGAEYFWDTAPAVGAGMPVGLTDTETFATGYPGALAANVDLSALPLGMHQLGFRVMDQSGRVSTTNWLPVQVFDPATITMGAPATSVTDTNRLLVAAEYFWDADPGVGQGTQISGPPDECFAAGFPGTNLFNQDISAFTGGFHTLGVRTLDGSGNWSVPAFLPIRVTSPPVITAPPQTLAAPQGGMTVLTVGVTGAVPLSYQWYFNGSLIPGASAATLSLSGLTTNNQGTYSVVVTNLDGKATSAPGTLTVGQPPQIVSAPQNALAGSGGGATFGVTATGYGVLAYQWLFNGTPLPGATNAILQLTGVTAAQAGQYTVQVTNLVGGILSPAAMLTISGTAVTSTNLNGNWMAANSPYIVSGNLMVASLVIQPGVSVLFNGPYSLTVTGRLQAAGTPGAPITFAGAGPGTGWQGLRLVGADTNSFLAGCVVSGAAAGGLRLTNSPLGLTNCTVANCTGAVGGGIYSDSPLTLSGCAILNNSATYPQTGSPYSVQGGGIFSAGGGLTLLSCLVSNNTAIMPNIGAVVETSTGGGIDCEAGALVLANCQIVGNVAEGAGQSATAVGGGLYLNNLAATLTADVTTFQSNHAVAGFGGGAGIGNAVLRNCVFTGNQGAEGGALWVGGNGGTLATNCLLTANAGILGGAVYATVTGVAGVFENCTVAGNSPDAFNGYTGLIHNSILTGNGVEIVPGMVTNPVVSYTAVTGGYSGPGGTNYNVADPGFANRTDYQLAADSPLIDAGDPAPAYFDQAFPPSLGGDRNDLGIYGGPGAALWPAFLTNAPMVLINGAPAAPYQVFLINVAYPPLITFTNGYPGGFFEYTLDGSDPLDFFTQTVYPFTLTNSAVLRVIAYSADVEEYSIAAPVVVNVVPASPVNVGSAGGGGVVLYPPGGAYLQGTTVQLTATNQPGWKFLGWSGDASGTNNPLPLVVGGPLNVRAVFGAPLSVKITGNGAVINNPAPTNYPYGSTVQLLATATNNGEYFRGWYGAGGGNSISPLDFVMTNAFTNVVALFGGLPPNNFPLDILVNGTGDVSRSPQANFYPAGTSVQLKATAVPPYVFQSWSGAGLVGVSNNPVTVTLTNHLLITANFLPTNQPVLPPTVALTNPVSGAEFLLPAPVTLQAAANDPNPNGQIVQVVFYANGSQIGVAAIPPYTCLWTNAPVGTSVVTAVASDNLGLSTVSAPISVINALPPPGPPVFTVGSANYSVLENGGSVSVTVQKSPYSQAGMVQYATADGTARAGAPGVGDYVAQAGTLTFGATDTVVNVVIPVTAKPVYQGNTTFSFNLAAVTNQGTLGTPASAVITIIDVNNPSPTNSFLAYQKPGDPTTNGDRLGVVLQPEGAGGGWRLVREQAWRPSRSFVGNLMDGNYEVEFEALPGYVAPVNAINPVSGGRLNWFTNGYAVDLSGQPETGALTVNLLPGSVATAGDLNARGQWQLRGAETDGWLNSGDTATNVAAGVQVVVFRNLVNYVTPEAREVFVGAGQTNVLTATYLPGTAGKEGAPVALGFDQISADLSPGSPDYGFYGQLLTDVGYGSGSVVQTRVVLTAGHLVFNDQTLTYATRLKWFFQRSVGEYEPPTQTARGAYVFSGYAAARTNDNSPGVESPASQNYDVAALYFGAEAGRGGRSGYLVSNAGGVQWLQVQTNSVLVGYPVATVAEASYGQMYATLAALHPFAPVSGAVFSTSKLQGYPGMSGGPVMVQYTNGFYYPAAVYLGGSAETVVREIDGDVADLINRAVVSAASGQNNGGGGVVALVPPGALGGAVFGDFQVVLGPPGAVAAGAAWTILELHNGIYASNNNAIYALPFTGTAGVYTVAFKNAPGYVTPGNRVFSVSATLATLAGTYTPVYVPQRLGGYSLDGGGFQLQLSAGTNQRYALDRSTNLLSWQPLFTNTTGTNGNVSFLDTNRPLPPRAFYRTRAVQ